MWIPVQNNKGKPWKVFWPPKLLVHPMACAASQEEGYRALPDVAGQIVDCCEGARRVATCLLLFLHLRRVPWKQLSKGTWYNSPSCFLFAALNQKRGEWYVLHPISLEHSRETWKYGASSCLSVLSLPADSAYAQGCVRFGDMGEVGWRDS